MNIMANKEYLDDLYQCIEKNLRYISAGIELHVTDKEIKDILKERLDEISYYLNRAYNPELTELKLQSRTYYQTWLHLKDIDNKTAQKAYFEYLYIKRKIEIMQIPF